ncbi:molecular chaperone, putative [Babesia caballi]|uniref:Molecular chaperone, putative n=1 Tax=Babesia caballi TaxID=5871 RepID=A0AAV4LUU8_BABCB|nr:molecular chaperone, putative [Babesia caballi]
MASVPLTNGQPPLRLPWKEVVDPATGLVYYWNTLTSETTWDRPVDAEPAVTPVPGSASAPSPASDNLSSRAEVWLIDYNACRSISDRVSVFFRGLELIRESCEEQEAISHKTDQERAASLLNSIDTALSSLTEILSAASTGTRNYEKLSGYKLLLERHRRALANTRRGSTPASLNAATDCKIHEICEEVATLSANLKALPHPSGPGVSGHVDALHDDYSVYMQRKKQHVTRQRWLDFVHNRRQSAAGPLSSPSQSSPNGIPPQDVESNTCINSGSRRDYLRVQGDVDVRQLREDLAEGTVGRDPLDVDTLVLKPALRLVLEVVLPGELGETPVVGDEDLLPAGELVLGPAQRLDRLGHERLPRPDGHEDLSDVHTGDDAGGLSEGAPHSGLEPVRTGTRKHLVDAQHVEGVHPDPDVEGFFTSGLDHELPHVTRPHGFTYLVGADTRGLQRFGRNLLVLARDDVHGEGEVIDIRSLQSHIVDSDFGVRDTSAEPRLGVGLVFAVAVTPGGSPSHFVGFRCY